MDQAKTDELVREVLGDRYLDLSVQRYACEEDIHSHRCSVRCLVRGQGPDGPMELEVAGTGVGFVDAAFHAFRDAFAQQYPSLQTIRFAGFAIEAEMATGKAQAATDAVGRVRLQVCNSYGALFEFEHASRSITASALHCVLAATEYFVNTERAYLTLHRALEDARRRNRPDLVERYQIQLGEIVKATSYSDVIERLRQGEGAPSP